MDGRTILIGFAAGLAGGAIGTLGMNLSQTAMRRASEIIAGPQDPTERSEENEPKHRAGANPTEKAYAMVAQPRTRAEQKAGGRAVHFGFGALTGGLYGMAAAAEPRVTLASGLAFGALVWLAANEIGLVAAGLTKPPQRYRLSTHLFSLASHLIYGVATNAVVRLAPATPRSPFPV